MGCLSGEVLSLGGQWVRAVRDVLEQGTPVDDEVVELLHYPYAVAPDPDDPILAAYANSEHIEEMRKVYHTTLPNRFGHSYRSRMRGPGAGDPVQSVIDALEGNRFTKRAVITLVQDGSGAVPCLNVVQFLLRDQGLHAICFARGQDMFNKFYADVTCVHDLAKEVAAALGVDAIRLSGVVGSAHVYLRDLPAARLLLASAG